MMNFSVANWEKLTDGSLVPICQPNDSLITNSTFEKPSTLKDDLDKMYVYVSLEMEQKEFMDARQCRKLFKNGYVCTQVNNVKITSQESDLEAFLYHHIVLELPNNPQSQTTFYFKRNNYIYQLSDSCYASDDRGVALLKMVGRKLRCCYLDLTTWKVKFKSIKVLPTNCGVKMSNGSIWIIQKHTSGLTEIFLLRFSEHSSLAVSSDFEVTINVGLGIKPLLDNVSVAENVFLLSREKQFVYFEEPSEKLCIKEIPTEVYSDVGMMTVVGNIGLVQGKNRKGGLPPKLYIVYMSPIVKVRTEIDLSVTFKDFKHFIPYGFQVEVFRSGMKALVSTGESYILVIDLLKGRLTQVLTYIDCFWCHKLFCSFSQSGQECRLIGKLKDFNDVTEHLCAKFDIWYGMTLKDFSKRALMKYFSIDDIRNFNIPKHLQKDLEFQYAY